MSETLYALIKLLSDGRFHSGEAMGHALGLSRAAVWKALQQLPEFDGGITILDAWGTPIYSTHPGAPAAPGVQPVDADGTERTLNESYYGIARNRRVCFVSAGPDRLFGLYWEFTGLTGPELEEAIAEAMKDNIYSYQPEQPQQIGYPGR